MSQADYDRGFADGLQEVATCLRKAAEQVEVSKRTTFQSKTNGQMIDAISRVGDVHFAAKLRNVAEVIEAAIVRQEPP